MPEILTCKLHVALVRYAVVEVYDADGTFNREFPITPEEYHALAVDATPAGVQKGERWVARGKRLKDPGDMEETDGEVLLMDLKGVVNGRTVEGFLKFFPGEYTGKPPNITVSQTVLDGLPQSRRPVSLVDGVLVK